MILFILVIPALVAIVVFFVARLILQKRKSRFVTIKALISGVLSVVAIFALLFLMFIGSLLYSIRMPRERFDRDRWHNEQTEQYTMSRDVMKRRLLIGKSRSDVCELLGDNTIIEQDSSKIVYFTGTQPSLMTGIHRTMEVYFENGKVISVELNVTDRDWVYTLLNDETTKQRLNN